MRILGIDPGATGAFALYDTSLEALWVDDMPSARVLVGKAKRLQLNEVALAQAIASGEPDVAWIERVHALPKQGVTSSFSFGLAYGIVRGILASTGVPYFLITPQEWKRSFRLGPDKSEARLVASRMFPANVASFARAKDDGRAEAALLALFGSQQQSGLSIT
jgi:crossover junction endodeoxyribonuclease RuvC